MTTNKLTAPDAIRREILYRIRDTWPTDDDVQWPGPEGEILDVSAVEDLVEETPYGADWLNEERSNFRCGYDQETDIRCRTSRNYDAQSVAAKLQDGSWVGWTYWSGGGKHAEPEAIPWMEDAYYLKVTSTRVVEIHEFKKVNNEI